MRAVVDFRKHLVARTREKACELAGLGSVEPLGLRDHIKLQNKAISAFSLDVLPQSMEAAGISLGFVAVERL